MYEVRKVIKSMTGFGRGESVSEECRITVEIKAVNHRYCDLNVKLPKKLNSLDNMIRNYLKKSVSRGKLDVFVSYEDLAEHLASVTFSESLSREYYDAVTKISELLHIPNDVTAMKIARMPEVLTISELQEDADAVADQVMEALEKALLQFNESREKEGDHLKEDILGKLSGMGENITEIEKRYPQMIADYRKKLTDKVEEVLSDGNADENRIATEVVIYADKICVDEETVRLRSHIKSMEDELNRGGSVGRKLDFIAQEMNREANTILSKANDIDISNRAIDLKTEVEKIREQVQNIE